MANFWHWIWHTVYILPFFLAICLASLLAFFLEFYLVYRSDGADERGVESRSTGGGEKHLQKALVPSIPMDPHTF